jgi:hypothetical protein
MSIVHLFQINKKKIYVFFTGEEKYKENSLLLKKLQCYGSGMFIPDPGSRVLKKFRIRIPDPDPHKRIQEFLTQKLVSTCKPSEI